MGINVTLATLLSRIRERGEIRSVYISDANLTAMLNASLAELHRIIVDEASEYFLRSQQYAIVSGTDAYDLPPDFYQIRAMDIQESSGDWANMDRFNFGERNQMQNTGADRLWTRYDVLGDKLRLIPSPGYNGTARMWYLRGPRQLATNLLSRPKRLGDTGSWTLDGCTITDNASADRDGESTLDSFITSDAVSDVVHDAVQAVTLTAASYVFSAFARAGAQNWLYMSDDTLTNGWAFFDITADAGVVGNIGADVDAAWIEDFGGGLFRCSIAVTGTAASHSFSIGPSDQDDGAKGPAFIGNGSTTEVDAGCVSVHLGDRPTPWPIDEFPAYAGMDEWAILNTCMMAAAKEESRDQFNLFAQQLTKVQAQVITSLGRGRDRGEPRRVRDVYAERGAHNIYPHYFRP